MAFGRSALAFYLAYISISHIPVSLALPQNAVDSDASATGISSTATLSTSEATPAAYTLPSGCRDSLQATLPTPTTWVTCNTTGWLRDLIQDNPQPFGNGSVVESVNGFMGAFNLATHQIDGCSFGQTCLYPSPPSSAASDFDTQVAIVQLAIYYISSWYQAANQVLIEEQIIKQSLVDKITSQLDIQQAPNANSGPSMGSIFNLVGSVLSILPNPYAKVAGGALRGISALMPPPPDNDVISINNIIALDDLEAELSASSGVAYTFATNALSTRFEQLFNDATDPMNDDGMFTMLQDGSWFDYTNNVQANNPTSTTQAEWLTYNWIISEVLQAQQVFLHALVVDTCPSDLGIQGNNCVEYDDITFVIWPALWNSNPTQTESISMGYMADIGVTTVQELTRHPNGGLIFANLVSDLQQQVDPNFMFASSLLCQLNATAANDLLAPWPASGVNSVYSNSTPNCLYNLPVVIDEQQATLPAGIGLLSSIQTPNTACTNSALDGPLNYQLQAGPGTTVLDFCNNAWALDEYAALALGILSSSDSSQYYYCGDLQANGENPAGCTGSGENSLPIIPPCAGPGSDNTCMCLLNIGNIGGNFARWLNGAALSCP